MMDLLLTNIGQLATPQGSSSRKGPQQKEITVLEQAMVGVKDGKLAYVGPHRNDLGGRETVDCRGALVTPGLVDAHTHLVFGGWRQHEMALKLEGVPYLEILARGGGILNTVGQTRKATEEELLHKGQELLGEMLRHGTTTCECKSGYGLDLATERKQLRVAKHLNETQPVELVSTFLGAHALPAEYKDNRDAYLDLVCDVMLPAVVEEKLAEYCDVFCETGVFTAAESERVLRRAIELGLGGKAHVDEIDAIGGTEVAAGLGAISCEHLIAATDDGIRALAENGVTAVLLPATSFYLNKGYARARRMIEEGVPVAVASDFNPGSSPNLNLQFAMNLACLQYRLTPGEVLTAATLNAAAAIGRADTVGSLEVGKKADLVVWNAPDLEYILYRYGSNQVRTVVKNGVVY